MIKSKILMRSMIKRMNNPKVMIRWKVRKMIRIMKILCFIAANSHKLKNNTIQSQRKKIKRKIHIKLKITLGNQKMK